jgi:toluene monooxygenase electron transfer component
MRIEITGRDGTVDFDCRDDQEILFGGLAAGIGLPYECGTGTCASCKATLESGTVDHGWLEAPARRLLSQEKNEILMCQARPREDCQVTIRGKMPEPNHIVPRSVGGVIASVSPLNHNVFRLVIRPDVPMPYDAGQFMLVDVPDVPGYRGWSMAAYDREAETLTFTVKMMPGGLVSQWLSDADRSGVPVRLFGPLGKASFQPERDTANLVCVAGGSGLAPILSILDRAAAAGHFEQHRADVFFGVRAFEDLYETDRLLAVAATHPDRVALNMVFSENRPEAVELASLPGVAIADGFVHEAMGQAMAGRFDGVLAYLAGPPQMVDAAMQLLVLQGKVPPARIRYDKFS